MEPKNEQNTNEDTALELTDEDLDQVSGGEMSWGFICKCCGMPMSHCICHR